MKLFEFAPTRSIRVRWTLQELAGCGKKEFPPPAPSLLSLPKGEK